MGSLENLAENSKFKEHQKLINYDLNGLNDFGNKFSINLKLSICTMLFQKDDYPERNKNLTERKDYSLILEAVVNSMELAERIVGRILGEIEFLIRLPQHYRNIN